MKYTRHPREEKVLGSWLHISQGVVDRKGKYGIPRAVVLGGAGVWEMGPLWSSFSQLGRLRSSSTHSAGSESIRVDLEARGPFNTELMDVLVRWLIRSR